MKSNIEKLLSSTDEDRLLAIELIKAEGINPFDLHFRADIKVRTIYLKYKEKWLIVLSNTVTSSLLKTDEAVINYCKQFKNRYVFS